MPNIEDLSTRSHSLETRASERRVETSSSISVPPLDLTSFNSPSRCVTTGLNGSLERRRDPQQLSSSLVTEQLHRQQLSATRRPHSPAARRPHSPAAGAGAGSSAAQQLPPACGARQLSKLKRFLTTIQQFSHDLSPVIGQHVRGLVLQLVNSEVSVEEFHARLQQLTNFPLRPFVIPFTKANLPLLQRELLHCAHLAKQSPHRYMLHNEHRLFTSNHAHNMSSTNHSHDITDTPSSARDVGRANKRPLSPETSHRSDVDDDIQHSEIQPRVKHPRSVSPRNLIPIEGSTSSRSTDLRITDAEPCGFEDLIRAEDDLRDTSSKADQEDSESVDRSGSTANSSAQWQQMGHVMDDLKRVENMLNCVVRMIDKCKETVGELSSICPEFDSTGRIQSAQGLGYLPGISSVDEFILTSTSKSNIDNDAADKENKEKKELDGLCWNCGRKAYQTCSGCGVARYCRTFCQHKDWHQHQSRCSVISEAVKSRGFDSLPGHVESTSAILPAVTRKNDQRDGFSSDVPDISLDSPSIDVVKQEKDV